MFSQSLKNKLILAFVIVWIFLFHYESLRHPHFNQLFGAVLPKVKLLFPTTGWSFLNRVDKSEVYFEVYGKINEKLEFIHPRHLFKSHWMGSANSRYQAVQSSVDPHYTKPFCGYLKRKFPQYETFSVFQVLYPSNAESPGYNFVTPVMEC